MSKLRKSLVRNFVGGLIVVFAAAITATIVSQQNASSGIYAIDATPAWTPSVDETELGSDELRVNVISSAITGAMQSVSASFTSKRIEAFPNDTKYRNVYIVPNDPSFDYITKSNEAKEKKEQEGDAWVMETYPASVYAIERSKSTTTVVIPSQIVYSSRFGLDIVGISANVAENGAQGVDVYDDIEKIVIPKTVQTIEAGAFLSAPAGVEIYCEAPEYVLDEDGNPTTELTYPEPESWAGVVPHYGYELNDDEKSLLNKASTTPKKFGTGADFIIGIENEQYNYPVYMEYKFEKQEGDAWVLQDEVHYIKTDITTTTGKADRDKIGTIAGAETVMKYVNVPLAEGMRVNSDSIRFHNIYRAAYDDTDSNMVPLLNESFGSHPSVGYTYVPHLADYYSFAPVSFTNFANYLEFKIRLSFNPGDTGFGVYPTLNPTMYSKNEAAIKNGTLQVRYQFINMNEVRYHFHMKDGQTVSARISTPVSYINLPSADCEIGFLLDVTSPNSFGIRYENIESVDMDAFTLNVDLYKPSTNSIVTKSATSIRFGIYTIFPEAGSVTHFDLNLIFIFAYVGYVVLFLGIAVGYYFYAKRRFRNDEFRRMNTKKYLFVSGKNFLGFAFVASAALFIIARWGFLSNSIVVFNPLDAFVIIFTLIGAIFLGFTIKNLAVSFKNAQKRKEIERLKLDQDEVDDGTH